METRKLLMINEPIKFNTNVGYMTLTDSCYYKPDPIPRLEELYTYKDNEYFAPKTYENYYQIKGGHVSYYPERYSVEDNFKSPVFTNTAYITANLYRDPMGNAKYQFDRLKLKNNWKGQLTSLQDQSEWREELIALQMRKHNRIQYDAKFGK
jgi:hypothetical protein